MKRTAPLLSFLILLSLLGCEKKFPSITVKVENYEKDIFISKNGKVMKVINNEFEKPLELHPELKALVDYDIDSTNRIIYINNFGKELLGISIDNGAIIYKSNLMVDSVASDEFYVQKYRDKILLGTEIDLLVYTEKLQLQKRLLDSVALKNPRIPKGFIGNFKYSLEGDSIRMVYNIERYLYGFNDLNNSVSVEEFKFKL